MNEWTRRSIQIANQDCYLDRLFKIYSISSNIPREISNEDWCRIRKSLHENDDAKLVESLLDFELFPVKDPYVPYLRRDRGALERNPDTVRRIAAQLRSMGLDGIRQKCSQPKEANRQLGPMFNKWIRGGAR